MTLVCDTGVVFAALVRADRHHARCASLVVGHDGVVVVPSPVLVEVDQLALRRRAPGATDALLTSVDDGSLLVANLDSEDYRRVQTLVRDYADLPLGLVDASVVAIAERLEEDTIATLDRRHFSVVRPLHAAAFKLVPELG